MLFVVMLHSTLNSLKIISWSVLNGCIVWYVNYITVKLFLKRLSIFVLQLNRKKSELKTCSD